MVSGRACTKVKSINYIEIYTISMTSSLKLGLKPVKFKQFRGKMYKIITIKFLCHTVFFNCVEILIVLYMYSYFNNLKNT